MDNTMTNQNEVKKASKLAIVCYSFGDLASQFVWTFVGSYLTIFYTDIVGLAPAVASAIMLIARIWDAVNDPMMGTVAERTRTKLGRFRPYIAFGCPLLAVFSVLCFTHPFSGGSTAGVIYAAATYIISGMLYTLVNIPYGSLASVMTEDGGQRNALNVSRNIGMNIGVLIVNSVTARLMLYFSGEGAAVANGRGYMMTVIVYAVISIPLFLAVFFTSKEQILPKENPEKFSFGQIYKNMIDNKRLLLLLVIMFLQMLAMMGRISVVAYYVIYCMGDFSMIAMIMTAPSICAIIASFILPAVQKRFGVKRTMQMSFFIDAAALLLVYLMDYSNTRGILMACCLWGFGNVQYPCGLSLMQDTVDWYDLKTGIRTDSTAIALLGLVQKGGNAVGAAVGLLIMSFFGYVANAEQTVTALKGINLTVNLLPAIIYLLAGLLIFAFKMTDSEAKEIRTKLKERNRVSEEKEKE